MRRVNLQYVGPPTTPQDIKRLRRQAGDYLRRYGQPIIHMHMWNDEDRKEGLAKVCPASYDDDYDHTRHNCPICFGVGYVSVENDPTRWIDARGRPTTTPTDTPAPLYGGFGEPTLSRAVLPDAATDIFRLNEAGALIRTQEAEAWAYFDPEMGDNDLIIEVELAYDDRTLMGERNRYQLKMVNPTTVRGWGKRTKYQNHRVGQNFHMNLVPSTDVLLSVPIGGIGYGKF